MSNNYHELVRMRSDTQAQSFDQVATLRRQGGEFYDLSVEVQIDPSFDFGGH